MAASHRFATLLALCVLALCPRTARGEADTFGLGSGANGAQASLTGAINRVARITSNIAVGGTSLTFDSEAGLGTFAAGDLVMIWQPTGLSAQPPFNQALTSLASERVGTWEFAKIATVGAPNMTLTAGTLRAYTANRAQVVRVPQYTNVTIPAGNTVSATGWDGARGGIVVFLATGTVTVEGTLTASSAGFRGGPTVDNNYDDNCSANSGGTGGGYAPKGEGIYWELFRSNAGATNDQNGRGSLANAAGGGDCHNSGGGGGGHATAGGQGGNSYDGDRPVGGVGGAALDDLPPDRLVFGGGGGAGETNDGTGTAGGDGGGVVFFRAQALAGAGTISANGQSAGAASNDGSGGGGAGGTVVVRVVSTASCGSLSAKGGNGGNSGNSCGAGGGGAAGRVFLQAASLGTCPADVGAGAGGTGGRTGSGGTAGTVEPSLPGGFCWAGSTVCSGATPSCDSALGSCVECANDGQCTDADKPVCDPTSHTCRACTADSDCTAPKKKCDLAGNFPGQCVECLAEVDCTSPLHCNTTSETCVACVLNSDCANPTPTCSGGACVACDADGDCTVDPNRLCQTSGALDGRCTQCTSTNVTACTTATAPACSASTGDCAACTGNRGATTDAPCPDPTKPVCTSGQCYQCSATNTARCTTDAAPACSATSRTCVACSGDNAATTDAPCPTTTKPVCDLGDGHCYQCTPHKAALCTTAAAPACVNGACAACSGDYNNDPNVDGACPTSTKAWCVSGTCHECTPTHLLSCTSAKPACTLSSGSCAPCDSDFGASTGDARCPGSDYPACLGSGQCAECSATNLAVCQALPDKPACMTDHTCGCSNDGDCRSASNQLRLCNTTTDTCFDGCRGNDDRCPSGQHCSASGSAAGVCVNNPGVDAGAPDVGQPDVGQPDVGQPDAGQPDAGQPDAGQPDVGIADVGTADVGSPDTGTGEDGGVPDTGPVEPADTGIPADAEVPADAAVPDGAVSDTGIPVVKPDASLDGGELLPPTYDLGGCGCGSAPGTSFAPWALLGLAVFAAGSRRRR